MKAWVLHTINNIKYEETDTPILCEHEVLLEVKAAGICGSDIPRIYKDGAHNMPLIPGHEFSGQVVQVGDLVDKKWLYKRVGVFPLLPCRKCIACQKEQYEMCRNYSYLGSRRNGGFAEYVAAPAENLIELPENVSYEAAAMLEPMAVAAHAMQRVSIMQNDKVAVCGLGTVGMLLVMLLLERGFTDVIAIGNKDLQKKMLLKLGLSEHNYCDCRYQDVKNWMYLHTNGLGADIFFECVGKNETFSQAINFTAIGGSVCLVGNPYTNMELERQIYGKILRNQLTVTGTWNSTFTAKAEDDWYYVLKRLEKERIMPEQFISHRIPFEKLNCGLAMMNDKTEDYIKVMIIMK